MSLAQGLHPGGSGLLGQAVGFGIADNCAAVQQVRDNFELPSVQGPERVGDLDEPCHLLVWQGGDTCKQGLQRVPRLRLGVRLPWRFVNLAGIERRVGRRGFDNARNGPVLNRVQGNAAAPGDAFAEVALRTDAAQSRLFLSKSRDFAVVFAPCASQRMVAVCTSPPAELFAEYHTTNGLKVGNGD